MELLGHHLLSLSIFNFDIKMVKLIIKSIIVAFTVITLIYISIPKDIINSRNQYYIDEHSLKNYNGLILGDSHFVPLKDTLEKYGFKNLAFISDNTVDMLSKLKYYNSQNIKRIILSADFHLFSNYRLSGNNNLYTISYSDISDYQLYEDNIYKYRFNKYRENSPLFFLTGKYTNTISMRFRLTNFKLNKSNKENEIQEKWENLLPEIRKMKAFDRAQIHYDNTNYSTNLINAYNEIIEFCNSNDIQVFLIRMPLTSEYNKYINESDITVPEKIYTSKQLNILDYRENLENQLDCFKDQDHLNEKGIGLILDDILKYIKN